MDESVAEVTQNGFSDCNAVAENVENLADISNLSDHTKENSNREKNKSKNSSLEEDLLGANSLLMSDTDDDDNDELKKNSKDEQEHATSVNTKKSSSNETISNHIQAMDDESEDVMKTQHETQMQSDAHSAQIDEVSISSTNFSNKVTENADLPEMEIVQKKKKKFLSPLDSDSDESETANGKKHAEKTKVDNESEEDLAEMDIVQKKKKFSSILDSDSDESETDVIKKQADNRKLKFSALIDSESESDTEGKCKNSLKDFKENSKFKLIDSDSEDNEKPFKELHSKPKKKYSKKTELIDSDSASELSGGEENETIDQEELDNLQQNEINSEDQTSGLQKKPMRASAKKALDEMQAIQSEQQRLHREAHISVPYHKPKRHTLQEFLKRRTIIKPATESECSPVAAILKKKSLKMSAEELEEYAKLMDERAKEAKEFFKSESESDEEELKDNLGFMDVNVEQQDAKDLENKEQNEEPTVKHDTEMTDTVELDTQITQPMDTEMIDNAEMELSVPEISSQPLVTEVLELPNLDLSTLHVNEKDDSRQVSINTLMPASTSTTLHREIEDLKEQLFNDQTFSERPIIKGDANMIIDLENGDMTEREPTGADNLLQRLLATHKTRKSKTSETVNILSTENGQLEMTKVNIHINDDNGVNKDHKPGAAYVKLKENLKTLIKHKRLEEMQKKLEDENEYNKCLEGDDDYDDDDVEDEEEYELKDEKEARKRRANLNEIIIDDEENALDACDVDDAVEELDAEEEEEVELIEPQAENDEEEVENDIAEDLTELEANSKSSESTDKDSSDSEDDNAELTKNTEFKSPFLATQRKTRIIKAFAEDSDDNEDDDMDLLKTQVPTVQTNIANPIFGNMESPLKSCISIPCSDVGVSDTQELMGLCSGSFDATQNCATSTVADTVIISQIPMTQRSHLNDASEELLGLCSGSFEANNKSQQQTQTQTQTESIVAPDTTQNLPEGEKVENIAYEILSSDEEGVRIHADTRNRVKKLRKKLKKRHVKLGFSDDEEETDVKSQRNSANDDADEAAAIVDEDENENEEIPQTYVEYDSEENEIIVEMTKGDCIKRAENFFEKEAELSESDWGSADEDEKHLDKYDIELGDEDEFDRAKLQQELGQIHARKMLDEDIREVRKIQELLFEDEETDGVGRQRQFRWKNAENGFSLDDMRSGINGEDGVDGESGDEEQKQEHLWRKIRFEREQLLKEQGLKENSHELVTTTFGLNSPLITPLLGSNTKKIQIITMKTTSTVTTKQNSSPFLISAKKSTNNTPTAGATPPTTSILQPKISRGSFLTRDKDTLTKFANLTKSKTTTGFDDDETAGTVSVKGKNFVFATLTKEEHETLKRKADDLMNSSTETGTNFVKKPRVNGDKQCLIDQLLV